MNDNDISVLDSLKKILKNPKSWLGRSLIGELKPSLKTEIRVEEGETQPETSDIHDAKPGGSASGNSLVQVDISIIIPAGSSIKLDVTTESQYGYKPVTTLEWAQYQFIVFYQVKSHPKKTHTCFKSRCNVGSNWQPVRLTLHQGAYLRQQRPVLLAAASGNYGYIFSHLYYLTAA